MPVRPRERVTLTFRDAVLIYKNFAGEQRKFNNKGDRNFSILLDEQQAIALAEDKNQYGDSWNVKEVKRREGEDDQLYHLKVSVKFDPMPPSCWLVSSGGRIKLPEEMVGMFDKLQSAKIDLSIVAFDWEVNGNTGRKAYLENIYFHLYENELDREYSSVPELPSIGSSMPPELESASRQTYDYDGEAEEALS